MRLSAIKSLLTGLILIWTRLAIASPRYQGSLDHQDQASPPLYANSEDSGIFPLDLRSINDYKLSDYLMISDIDGNLHSVDRNSGHLIWSLPFEEPLIHIEANTSHGNSNSNANLHTEASSDREFSDESNILWFVEPYNDGSLYYFTPEFGLNKLPASIKELVLQSPFSLAGDDKIYTGTRKTSLYTINIHTGEIISQFGDDKCPTSTYQETKSGSNPDYMMIGKTVYELTIHSRKDSNIVWYVTYSQWGPNNIDNDLILQNQKSLDELYFTPFHDKSLLAINKELGTPIWISKLPSLAVNVFDIFNNKKLDDNFVILPHPLKVLNNLQINQDDGTINNDLCFINKTADSDQWFAMSFINYPTLIKSAPISEYQMSLFKVDNNYYDMGHLNTLRYLKLNDDENDHLINGIHKIHHLSSDTMYQPVSKFSKVFEKFSIDDGGKMKDMNEQSLPQQTSTNMAIPNIIEGIKFQSRSQNELLPTSPKEQDYLLIESTDKSEFLPKNYYDQPSNTTNETNSLSLVKKICEDIIVILLLMVLLLALSKTKTVFRRVREFYEGIEFRIVIDKKKTVIDKRKASETDNFRDKDEKNDDVVLQDREVNNSSESSQKKVTIVPPNESVDNDTGNEDNDNSNDDGSKKKRKRGSRGGRRGNKKKNLDPNEDAASIHSNQEIVELDLDNSSGLDNIISTTSLVKMNKQNKVQAKKLQIENNLIISDKILGYGSHGTVVYQGTFENRPVAVKRMLLDFYDVANHEVSLLQQSDDHPNVIRYFCSQSSLSEKFLYIALELCQGSLDDLIERNKFSFQAKKDVVNLNHLLYQLANGLHYLHDLKIVHRDLKPQNILIGDFRHKMNKTTSNSNNGFNSIDDVRLLISDFGLCKKLDHDQSSFRATSQNAASGTSGWRAPELLLNHELVEISPDTISSIGSHTNTSTGTNPGNKRLTKSIDIFSLGCVFFYILTGGRHPFGDRYSREGNIVKGQYDLSLLDNYEDKVESKHMIAWMIDSNASNRPNTHQVLKHPFFWTKNKKLEFLLKVSDRFEIERRDPPSDLLLELESAAHKVTKGNWHNQFDEEFMNNLGKYRKYHSEKLMDLLRALRNKYHHFNDMPPALQRQMTPLPDEFYNYFNRRFPNLLMEIYFVIDKNLKSEHLFQEYY